jgi:hypothetical protein
MEIANTLAYYDMIAITAVKSLPGANPLKLFTSAIYEFSE